METLRQRYVNEIVPELEKRLGVANRQALPRLNKVVVNMGIGIADRDAMNTFVDELAKITGQRPEITKARKSISNFKLREGMPVGARVTLRGQRMYDFLERLINAALPRIRDFRGLPVGGFDGHGNYTLGVNDQTIFPEIDPDEVSGTQGLNVTIVTSVQEDDAARELLSLVGLPFAKN